MNIKTNYLSISIAFSACCFIAIYCMNLLSGTDRYEEKSSRISKLELPDNVKAKIKDLPRKNISIKPYQIFDNSFTCRGITVYATSETPKYYLAHILKGLAKLDTQKEAIPSNAAVIIYAFDQKDGGITTRCISHKEYVAHLYRYSNHSESENSAIFYDDIKPEDRPDKIDSKKYKQLQDALPALPNIFSEWLSFQKFEYAEQESSKEPP